MICKSATEWQANGPNGESSLSTETHAHLGPLYSSKTCLEDSNAAGRLS